MVMGFQNYSSLPRHLRGMLGLSPELDSATYSGSSRTQVCAVIASAAIAGYYAFISNGVAVYPTYHNMRRCKHMLAKQCQQV